MSDGFCPCGEDCEPGRDLCASCAIDAEQEAAEWDDFQDWED